MDSSKPAAKAFAPCSDPNGIPNDKTGNMFTAVMHIFCAIVGAGVLALPSTVAWLGWVAGPIMLIVFYVISLISSNMLADVYCVDNTEFARYHHAVRYVLGRFNAILLSIAQLSNLFLITIAYTITGSIAMKTIAQRSCAIQGIAQEDCWSTTWKLTLLFGASQCLLSQVKNLESAWWVSSIGVATSLTYSTIALVLGCVYSGAHAGSVGGISANTPNKAFGVLNALGGIAFAYSFSLILLEIQDTLRQPPSTTKTMKGAVNIGVTASFMFYFTVAVVGYCALGNDVPGMVLAGFPQAPNWVIMLANVCILIHMLAAFQTYAQPMYDTIESWIKALMLRREQGKAPQGAAVKTEPAPTAATEEGRGTVTRSEDSAHHLNRRSVRNTAPVPTLRPSMGYGRTSMGYGRTSVGSGGRSPEARSPGLGRHSQGSIVHALERLSMASSMYHVDTGFTNEAVPLNDELYFVPLWVRLIVRTLYVIVVTVLAVVMPFFGSIVGLIGAATFLPLAIYFPYLMYNKVHKPRGLVKAYMWVTGIFMGLVCGAATVAAVRGIILSWSTYTIFGD